jgi:uncharacterized membrane protein
MRRFMSSVTARWAQFALLTLVLTIAASSQAHAWLKVCNRTTKMVSYHHNVPDSSCQSRCGGDHSRYGWYNISPNACKTVYSGSAANQWFEWYAESVDGVWVWTSADRRWSMSNDATNGWCNCIECSIGGGGSCYPNYNHRLLTSSTSDYTLNLN